MDDNQTGITDEDQRLQQAQNTTGTSAGTPAGGQSTFSADYSVAQNDQDSESASPITADNQETVEAADNTSAPDDSSDAIGEVNEEDETAATMNDSTEVDLDVENGDLEGSGDEVVEEPEEPAQEEQQEQPEEPEEPAQEEQQEQPAQEEQTAESEGAVATAPGSVVVPDGQTSEVPGSIPGGAEQQASIDGPPDGDDGTEEVAGPDLTPETDAASVEDAIDGAFADFNGGNDAGATETLGGVADE